MGAKPALPTDAFANPLDHSRPHNYTMPMENSLKSLWGQVTTGHGAAAIMGVLTAVYTGQMSWPTAIPTLIGAAFLVAYPENAPASAAAAKVATDLVPAAKDGEALIAAFAAGIKHGSVVVPPAP